MTPRTATQPVRRRKPPGGPTGASPRKGVGLCVVPRDRHSHPTTVMTTVVRTDPEHFRHQAHPFQRLHEQRISRTAGPGPAQCEPAIRSGSGQLSQITARAPRVIDRRPAQPARTAALDTCPVRRRIQIPLMPARRRDAAGTIREVVRTRNRVPELLRPGALHTGHVITQDNAYTHCAHVSGREASTGVVTTRNGSRTQAVKTTRPSTAHGTACTTPTGSTTRPIWAATNAILLTSNHPFQHNNAKATHDKPWAAPCKRRSIAASSRPAPDTARPAGR